MDKNTIRVLLETVSKKDLAFSEFSDEEKRAVVSLMHELRKYQRSKGPNSTSVDVLKGHYGRIPENLKEFITPAKNKLKKLFYGSAVYGLEDINPDHSDKICLFTNSKEISDMFGSVTVSGADVRTFDIAIDLNKLNSFSGAMLRDADKVKKHGSTRVSRNYDAMHKYIDDNDLNLNIEVSYDNSEVVVLGVKYYPPFEHSKKLNAKEEKLSESMDEVTKTPHFFQRYGERISGKDTTFSNEDPDTYNEVVKRLRWIDEVNFPRGWDVAILFWSSNKKYKMKSQKNVGSDLWGIVRSVDTLLSIGWYPTGDKPKDLSQDVDGNLFITYDLLKSLVDEKGYGVLNDGDMNNLKDMMENPNSDSEENPKKTKLMSLQKQSRPKHKRVQKTKVDTGNAMFWRLDGVGWMLDPDKGIAYKKNKPSVSEPLDSFVENNFNKASEEQQEKLMSLI